MVSMSFICNCISEKLTQFNYMADFFGFAKFMNNNATAVTGI